MFNGLKALLNSEKALAGGALIVAATALVITGHMTVAQWQAYTEVVFLGYVGGKTIQGSVALLAAPKADKVEAEAHADKAEDKAENKAQDAKTEDKTDAA